MFYVSTERNGRRQLGTTSHFCAVWHDLKTVQGAINRACRLGPSHPEAKRGDYLVIEQISSDQPYGTSRTVARILCT